MVYIQEYVAKKREDRRYNTKIRPKTMEKGDLVLKWVVDCSVIFVKVLN